MAGPTYMTRVSSSLRLRLVVMILVVTVPVMTVAILGPTWLTERIVRDDARLSLARVATGLADKVVSWDEQVINVLRQLSRHPAIRSMDVAQQRPVLKRIAGVYNWFHLVCVVHPSGLSMARADDQEPKYYHDRNWFTEALAGRDEGVRQAVISKTTGLPGMTIGMPIRADDGKVVGVVAVGMSLTRLSERVGAVSVGHSGTTFVVDDRGLLVAHGHLSPSERLIDYTDFPPVTALLRHNVTGNYSFTDPDGARWMAYLVRVPNGWGVVSMQREADVLAEAGRIRVIGLSATVAATALVAALTWMLATQITRPVRALTNASELLAAGHWDVTVPDSAGDDTQLPTGRRRDELDRLSMAFNRMAVSLQRSYRLIEERVAQRTEQLRKSNAELRDAREAAYALSRAKDEFLANMSHELRTPLTTILGYANLLTDPDLSAEQRTEHVGQVQRSARHLLAIINEVLDLSSIDAGRMTVVADRVDVTSAVDDAVASLRPRADEKKLSLAVVYDDGVPRFVRTDGRRLRQILINLVGNAIKFTENGSVIVHVRNADPLQTLIQFDVIDTGIGMTDQQMSRLFQRFSQVDTSPSRRYAGTGLGLVISKRLARMLGGDISVVSEPGAGSTFTLTIDRGEPFTDDATANAVINPSSAAPTPPAVVGPVKGDLAGLRVLLAEDVPMNRTLFTMILTRLGATVTAVADGQQAIDAYTTAARDPLGPPDVVLMDMQMPVVDGYEATAQLRRAGVTTPIIALTAHARDSERATCIGAGCTDFITKPLDPAILVETIQRHVGASPSVPGPA
jgi:signal transduction histidine kinase/ActR/RegA family two-component response regulator